MTDSRRWNVRREHAVREPDAGTCHAALRTLLHAMPHEQQVHGALFLLQELERLYVAGGLAPPAWIGALRTLDRECEP